MVVLMLFALVAGAATALTPCVLPVLPALLSASATGGRRRPLGIVLGLVATHTIAIVALASVIDGVGLADGTIRAFAIAVLGLFGVALVWPALGDRIEAPLSRLARFGPRDGGDGFTSGLVVGGALGFVYAPCAGPILAAVVSVGATGDTSSETVAIALAYGVGSGIVLLGIALGGRRVLERVRRAGRGPAVTRALGVVMVLTAVAMAAELDVRFQTALASDVPSFISNPTRARARSSAVEDRLAQVRGEPRFDSGAAAPHGDLSGGARPAAAGSSRLPDLGPAPEFIGNDRWFNTTGGRPLTLAGLRGRVVLIDFWTYTCINCIRTFPFLRAWDERYRDRGLTTVGVHTPEFAFERDGENVQAAIEDNELRYPVAQDNGYDTWNAWGNQYWPAKYLIDAEGRVRYTHFGEGDYEETERAIRALLEEAGEGVGEGLAKASAETPDPAVATPETYLGSARAEGWLPGPPVNGTHRYLPAPANKLPPNGFTLSGTWRTDAESSTAGARAALDARFLSKKVFLVASSRDERPRRVRVFIDGRPYRTITVTRDDIYTLADFPQAGEHRLRLEVQPGVSLFAFTFG